MSRWWNFWRREEVTDKCIHDWKTTYWEDGSVANVYCSKCKLIYLSGFRELGTKIKKELYNDSKRSNTK